MLERELWTDGPVGALGGMLAVPGDAPAKALALIIPGSGPTNRDGDTPPAVLAGTYKRLAAGLAARGIATLRIDKRGMFSSDKAIMDPNAVTIQDYADDANAWIDAARAESGCETVWLLGHSEGALVSLVAAQSAPRIGGLILVAGPGRPLADVMAEQFRESLPTTDLREAAVAAIQALARGETIDTGALPDALTPVFHPAALPFLMDICRYNPAELIAQSRGPVLILQGSSDLQVKPSDAERLQAAYPQARLVLLSDVNHVLKPAPVDDRAANIATYGDPRVELATSVVPALTAFILADNPSA